MYRLHERIINRINCIQPISHTLHQQIFSLSTTTTTDTIWIPPDTLPNENDIDHFRQQYFAAEKPAVVRSAEFSRTLPGYQKWFVQHETGSGSVGLNYEYLSKFGDAVVPLEMTATTSPGEGELEKDGKIQFKRLHAPLSMFLAYTQFTSSASPGPQNQKIATATTIYLAQAHISDLPPTLSSDFSPPPRLVTETGRNDIYAANLWIGSPPTYTPLHKDPNPNLFVQLAGYKRVRILEPRDGMRVFTAVRNQIANSEDGNDEGGAAIRGEEMMMGSERKLLNDVIWGDHHSDPTVDSVSRGMVGYDVLLERGDALFIPKGWWHSLKGVGEGITASVCSFLFWWMIY